MMKRLAIGAVTAAMLASAVGASAASAAVEFGNDCTPTVAPEDTTFIQLQNPPGALLPAVAPISGVLTQWRVNFPPESELFPAQTLKIVRPAGGNQYTVIAEANGSIVSGKNVFPARIPIQAGDILGLSGGAPLGGLVCAGGSGGRIGQFAGQPTVGSTNAYLEIEVGATVDVVGAIEPDADGDGYGDETQDLCPQSAALQTACPVVTIDAFSVAAGNAVKVLVATSGEAPVKVAGTVKLGKGGAVKLSAKARTVASGKIAVFKLKLSGKLKKKLKELPPKKKLKLKIVASATDVAGRVSSDRVTVKLKGTRLAGRR